MGSRDGAADLLPDVLTSACSGCSIEGRFPNRDADEKARRCPHVEEDSDNDIWPQEGSEQPEHQLDRLA